MKKLALVLVLILGCDSREPEKKPLAAHAHAAPHGGTLVDLGGAHIELVVERETGKVTGYVLDDEAEKSVRVEQKVIRMVATTKSQTIVVDLEAVGNPLTGEKPGDTSQFEGRSTPLQSLPDFECRLQEFTVKGKLFSSAPFPFPRGNEK
jgi:hypothetical protein